MEKPLELGYRLRSGDHIGSCLSCPKIANRVISVIRNSAAAHSIHLYPPPIPIDHYVQCVDELDLSEMTGWCQRDGTCLSNAFCRYPTCLYKNWLAYFMKLPPTPLYAPSPILFALYTHTFKPTSSIHRPHLRQSIYHPVRKCHP